MFKNYDTKPCWILCYPRTGSSLLCELLNNFKVFPTYNHPSLKFISNTNLLRKEDSFNEWCRLFNNVEEFVNNTPPHSKMIFHQYVEVVGSIKKEKRYNVGWYNFKHNKNFINKTIKKYNSKWVKNIFPNICYIRLRRNTISHAISLYFARFTKKYHIYNQEDLKKYLKIKIDLNCKKLKQCYLDSCEEFNSWQSFLSENDNILDVYYENLLDNPYKELYRISNFLKIKCDIQKSIDLTMKENKRIYKMTRKESVEYEEKLKKIIKIHD